jgi:hypothetical protein
VTHEGRAWRNLSKEVGLVGIGGLPCLADGVSRRLTRSSSPSVVGMTGTASAGSEICFTFFCGS